MKLKRGGKKLPAPPAATSSEAEWVEAEQAEALAKLKDLLDSGVLTEEQYEAERKKLQEGR
jgi:hypothetical protein